MCVCFQFQFKKRELISKRVFKSNLDCRLRWPCQNRSGECSSTCERFAEWNSLATCCCCWPTYRTRRCARRNRQILAHCACSRERSGWRWERGRRPGRRGCWTRWQQRGRLLLPLRRLLLVLPVVRRVGCRRRRWARWGGRARSTRWCSWTTQPDCTCCVVDDVEKPKTINEQLKRRNKKRESLAKRRCGHVCVGHFLEWMCCGRFCRGRS